MHNALLRAPFRVTAAVAAALLVAGGTVAIAAPSAASPTVVFSDGFEDGNTWAAYSNGTDMQQAIVSSPVHSGAGALQISATTSTSASEAAVADIKEVSFTEDASQLGFWYYASGGANYTNLTVEAYTSGGAEYFELLPGAVVTNAWTYVTVQFAQISPLLAGASMSKFVIKAVATPNSGDEAFTIDDVAITNGVAPPANLVVTSPAPSATGVAPGRVITAFFDAPLDPASVSPAHVQFTDAAGNEVAAAVRYEAGQDAVAVVPTGNLAAHTTYTVDMHDLTTPNGGGTTTDPHWSFTTGGAGAGPEQVLEDDLDDSTGWTGYSNAATSGMEVVSSPVVSSPTALQVTASDASSDFVASAIRSTNWLDENSQLNFSYQLSGTATPKDLIVALTTAAGFTKFTSLPIPAPASDTWHHVSIAVSAIDPGLVGQVIRTAELKIETSSPGALAYTVDDFGVTESLAPYDHAARASRPGSVPTVVSPRLTARLAHLISQIKKSQQPDGSIVVGPTDAGFGSGTPTDPYPDQKVDPYAANYAALGLLRAYQVTGQAGARTAADRWLSWYQDHLAPDGVDDDCVGYYPDCVDTGDQDSVDSYASTYLLASLKAYTVRNASGRSSYLAATYPYVLRAAAALDSVYQQDGTTIAKPSYPVRYTMDNAETYNGLLAAFRWARAEHDTAQAKLSRYLASRTLYALRNRFDAPSVGYAANAVDPNGALELSLDSWYPDALSSVLLLAQVGHHTSADQALFDRLVTQFDVNDQADRPTSLTDTPQYMWWAQAAERVGEPQQARHFVAEYRSIEGARNPGTFAITAGHEIRVLAYTDPNSLWW